MMNNDYFIEMCCVCGSPLKTKKELTLRSLFGSETEIYRQQIGICPDCGLVVTQNPFTPEQLENRYKNMSKYEYDSQQNIIQTASKSFYFRCKNFLDENLGEDGYGSLLEVGAASGANLSIYAPKKRYGIEPSRLNCELARKNYGVELFNGMWSDFFALKGQSEKKEKYDLIFLSMTLEHIVNPYQFILECKEFCNNYIFILVPTLDYRFLDQPYGLFCEEHVNYFTLKSLEHLMGRAGFSLLNCEILFPGASSAGWPAISTLWQKGVFPKVFDLPETYSSEDKLDQYLRLSQTFLESVDEKIKKIPNDERLALWGLGNHASLLLANTDLANKNIVRVYDSDVKKQGLSFVGLTVEPFTVDNADTVEGILVTTYAAQRAILRDLQKAGYAGKVYTLYDIVP